MLSIIIIGAGASGLYAGRCLSAAGHRVVVLEAAAEPGGRILGLRPAGFSGLVEGGAEFIHGELPLSLALAREAGVGLTAIRAKMMQVGGAAAEGETGEGDGDEEGDWEGLMGDDWREFMQRMEELAGDMPIADFLEKYFAGERYSGLRESVRRFAEGYDLADIHRVSTRALYKEWAREGEDEEYRPDGGYRRIIDWLAEECRRKGAELHYSSPVVSVSWRKGMVEVMTAGGGRFVAEKCIVTVSLGVLQAGALGFQPALPEVEAAAQRLGYGSVIKILLEFRRPFWLEKKPQGQTLFVLSDQPVPTWWTQTEDRSGVITGWLAGERMRRFQQLDAEAQLSSCLQSLGAIFSIDAAELRPDLSASMVLDWANGPYVRGGYSFETVGGGEAQAVLAQPVEDTIYFAGEALYEGIAPGTVEAAFASGQAAAERIGAGCGPKRE